jgi:hypothetical protein
MMVLRMKIVGGEENRCVVILGSTRSELRIIANLLYYYSILIPSFCSVTFSTSPIRDLGFIFSHRACSISPVLPAEPRYFSCTVSGCDENPLWGSGYGSDSLYANLDLLRIHGPYLYRPINSTTRIRSEMIPPATYPKQDRDRHTHQRQEGKDAHRPLVTEPRKQCGRKHRKDGSADGPQDDSGRDGTGEIDAVGVHQVRCKALQDLRDPNAKGYTSDDGDYPVY